MAPAVPPLCRETQSLGQQMLNATVGINGLSPGGTREVLVCVSESGSKSKIFQALSPQVENQFTFHKTLFSSF